MAVLIGGLIVGFVLGLAVGRVNRKLVDKAAAAVGNGSAPAGPGAGGAGSSSAPKAQ